MRALMRSTLKSLAQFFKYRPRVQEAVFIFESRSSSESELNFFIYKRSLVITDLKLFVAIFLKSFAMAEKQKSRDELYANKSQPDSTAQESQVTQSLLETHWASLHQILPTWFQYFCMIN